MIQSMPLIIIKVTLITDFTIGPFKVFFRITQNAKRLNSIVFVSTLIQFKSSFKGALWYEGSLM